MSVENKGGFWAALGSTDHKTIGKEFLYLAIFWAFAGGLTAWLMRWQLAFPNTASPLLGKVEYGRYNMLVTMHGTIMVFFVAMPGLVAAFSNYVIPLQVGAPDMAFPRLNRLSFHFMLAASALLLASLFVPGGAAAAGWTAYPPLSADPKYTGVLWGAVLWILALALAFSSSTMGGINYIATVLTMRAPGMTWDRIPLATWGLITGTLDFFFSVGPLIAGALMMLLDLVAGTGFYLPEKGGEPLLWQHLFWFFGHPEVYVIFVPGLMIVFEIIPHFARKPAFGYKWVLLSLLVSLVLAYVVWAHHMFISGMNPKLAMPFSVMTILISVPFSVIFFSMFATLRKGALRLKTPLLWAVGFLATFLVGGLTGIFLGSATADIYFHDTYFVVAHFHYTLFPATFFGIFAAVSYWFPKIYGRMMSEALGRLHFILSFVFFNCVFWPLFRVGIGAMPRRIADPSLYPHLDRFKGVQVFVTVSAVLLICSQAVFLWNFFRSMKKGEPAGDNPWEATTLEWSTSSPPPHGNFTAQPRVLEGPYEYGRPGLKNGWITQTGEEA